MSDLLTIVPVAVAAFIATNLDNLLLLIALLAQRTERRAAVLSGYVMAMAVLIGAAFAVGKAAEVIPIAWLGYLGIVPICLGIAGLVTWFRPAPTGATGPVEQTGAVAMAGSVALTQLGNGADTLVTLSVLFADSAAGADVLILASLTACVVTFGALATAITRRGRVAAIMQTAGRLLTPILLIVVGAYVLADTLTDMQP